LASPQLGDATSPVVPLDALVAFVSVSTAPVDPPLTLEPSELLVDVELVVAGLMAPVVGVVIVVGSVPVLEGELLAEPGSTAPPPASPPW